MPQATAAQEEVAQIHSAIAEQLEIAEAEHEAEQAADAETQRRWVEQIDDLKAEQDVLQGELRQERFWREQLQKRIEALRLAAVDLSGGELVGPPAPGAMVVPKLRGRAAGDSQADREGVFHPQLNVTERIPFSQARIGKQPCRPVTRICTATAVINRPISRWSTCSRVSPSHPRNCGVASRKR